ncbi:hypothetical protein Nepgr_016785 [Nepenthes gracilis]|uniref:glucan endo-1,3-beta-D-glucosidase n=1 Tax=Nepenthes gracilis TaxID=150966 RepID=A0AAD3SQC5_NEPGR|nr:hypothetical protein Nepgr_016785 [Nepenthes gracilis]
MALAVVLLSALVMVGSVAAADYGWGVNWGNIDSHPLSPSVVVGMLKDNGIQKVKLFDSDHWTVSALAGTGIEVMIAIPNNQLDRFTDYGTAKNWVKNNVTVHIHDGGVNIKYVAVGNEPFLTTYNGSYLGTTFPALKNIQKALEENGLVDKIKATVPLNADVYESNSNMPSQGDFREDIKDLMIDIVKFLKEKDSPFVVNIYPFLSLYQNPDFPTDFAFFDGVDKPINDKGKTYSNVFEANFDTLVWTLKKNGVGDLKIVVGEIGWPTDGHPQATVENAKKFYDGLSKSLATNKGTPMRSGRVNVYLFSLLDENMKSVAPGKFERHWGLFRYDGRPKFPMDLTGKGHDKLLIGAKNVQYLESKWCVFNSKKEEGDSKIPVAMDYACSRADCTPLAYGGSCNNLDSNGNISYAFNMFFQMNDQSVEACDFDGLGEITTQNASTGTCLFPIEIVSGANKVGLVYAVSAMAGLLLILLVFV